MISASSSKFGGIPILDPIRIPSGHTAQMRVRFVLLIKCRIVISQYNVSLHASGIIHPEIRYAGTVWYKLCTYPVCNNGVLSVCSNRHRIDGNVVLGPKALETGADGGKEEASECGCEELHGRCRPDITLRRLAVRTKLQ
jgi:hypothetical protein